MFKNTSPKQIQLKVTKTRHLICRARINGVKAVLLIDTGASNSCIALSEKEKFNVKEKGDPFKASGAGKDKVEAVLGHQCDLILEDIQSTPCFVGYAHINATLMHET